MSRWASITLFSRMYTNYTFVEIVTGNKPKEGAVFGCYVRKCPKIVFSNLRKKRKSV